MSCAAAHEAGPGAGEHPHVEPYRFVEEPEQNELPTDVLCPRCGGPTRVDMVRSDIWDGDRLTIVEDIPAHVCDSCLEQFYSEPVTDALRRLVQEGLDSTGPKREMVVPVYSLTGRIRGLQPAAQDDCPSEVPPVGV